MRVLGLDPGLRLTGYAALDVGPVLVEAGVIRLVTGGGRTAPVADRLVELERDAAALIERVRPDAVAVEALFSHARFPQAALAMAHARGVLLLAARRARLDVVELAPRLVKMSLTGSGRASKQQMQLATQRLLDLPRPPRPPDVADAIAVALAGLHRSSGVAIGGAGG